MASAARVAGRQQNRWGEGERLRAEIVAAARRLLERDGTEAAVTLRGVAREAGITAPAIYAHFDDRQQLVEAVVAAVADLAIARLDEGLRDVPSDASPRDRLRAYCEVYIGFALERPASYQVLFVRPNPSEMLTVRKSMSKINQDFEALISVAVPSLSATEVSVRGALMWSALHGLAGLPPHHPRFAWPDRDALIDELLNLHLVPSSVRPGR